MMATNNIQHLLSTVKDDHSTFVKDIKTRMLTNRSKLYTLLNEENPLRVDELHYVSVLGMGGLYPSPDVVEAILDPANSDTSGRKVVLELGCRSGIWSIEMARKFPNAEVIGIDRQPVPISLENIPKNCQFEVDDLNADLSRFHGQIDVALVRNVGRTIKDYPRMMQDIEACAKFGGIVIFMDSDINFYLRDTNVVVPLGLEIEEGGDPENSSWIHRLSNEYRRSVMYDGSDAASLEDCIDSGIWNHPLIDPDTVRGASMYTPVGTWLQAPDKEIEERFNFAGALMRKDLQALIGMFNSYLTKYGVPETTVQEWSKRANEELEGGKFSMSVRWRCTWGRRRAGDNIPAPALVVNPSTDPYALGTSASESFNQSNANDYRCHQIYKTKEEAKQAAEARNESLKRLPVPLVSSLKEPKN